MDTFTHTSRIEFKLNLSCLFFSNKLIVRHTDACVLLITCLFYVQRTGNSQNQTAPNLAIFFCDSCFVLGSHCVVKSVLSDFIYKLYFSVHKTFSFFTLLNSLSLHLSLPSVQQTKTLLKVVKYPGQTWSLLWRSNPIWPRIDWVLGLFLRSYYSRVFPRLAIALKGPFDMKLHFFYSWTSWLDISFRSNKGFLNIFHPPLRMGTIFAVE